MTNRKNKNKKLVNAMKNMRVANRPKKATPFKDVGGIVGNGAANLLGLPFLKGVGKWLGSGIGSIFGSGDYTVTGPTPDYNILSGQTPKFSTTHATNIISHREYLGDITGTAGFVNTTYPINPGMPQTFPWLSTIAGNYQQYRFHGLIFEFRPLITDFVTSGAPGVFVMTTNYNADSTAFASRQEAENAEFAVATKPTLGLIHMIECAVNEGPYAMHYVRSGAPPAGQDLRLYDVGLTQLITQNNPVQVLGELWVSYTIEFFKPTIPSSLGIVDADGYYFNRSGVDTTNPFGTTTVAQRGQMVASITATSITMTGLPIGKEYMISIFTYSGNTATTAFPVMSFVNCTVIPGFQLTSAGSFASTGTVSNKSTFSATFKTTATNPSLTFATTGGLFPTACSCDIYIMAVDPFIN